MQQVHSSLHPEGHYWRLGGEGNQFAVPCNNMIQPMTLCQYRSGWYSPIGRGLTSRSGMPLKRDGLCLSRIWGLDSRGKSQYGYGDDIVMLTLL